MDDIFKSLKDWIKTTITDVVDKLVAIKLAELESTLLKRKEVAEMLRIDVTTFDDYYRYMDGFPRELPAKRWSKLEIIKWLENTGA